VLQELHAVNGVFAMQNQSAVVNACKELEYAYQYKVPDSFFVHLDFLQVLIREKLGEMLASAESGFQRGVDVESFENIFSYLSVLIGWTFGSSQILLIEGSLYTRRISSGIGT